MGRFALLYSTVLLASLVTTSAAPGQSYPETVLYSFTGGADGASPRAGLIRDNQGNLYSTTPNGGNPACYLGCGTVYKLSPAGKYSVLYSFAGYPDGSNPSAGLLRDAAGNLYGTTAGFDSNGAGTVFKLDTTGKETLLYSFSPTEGGGPYAGLVQDAAGNLYGTDPFLSNGYGAVYEVSANGQESTLYTFSGGSGPQYPIGGLVLDAAGNLYGTTYEGGLNGCGCCACGTLFELSSSGLSVLHNFAGYPTDGGLPRAALLRDMGGNIYGVTLNGGGFGYGTVFKLDATGRETVLYSFTGGTDGGYPLAGLAKDRAGNFYGTTSAGGTSGKGTVFKLDSARKETTLYSFTGGVDGATPYSAVILDAAGNLYGTTLSGGAYGYGTVFVLDPANGVDVSHYDGNISASVWQRISGVGIKVAAVETFNGITPSIYAAQQLRSANENKLAVAAYAALNFSNLAPNGSRQIAEALSAVGSQNQTKLKFMAVDVEPCCLITAKWKASQTYAVNTKITDPLNHVQKVTAGGTSGATAPAWDDSRGNTTDGGVTWTDQGAQHFVSQANRIQRIGQAVAALQGLTPPLKVVIYTSADYWQTITGNCNADPSNLNNPCPDLIALPLWTTEPSDRFLSFDGHQHCGDGIGGLLPWKEGPFPTSFGWQLRSGNQFDQGLPTNCNGDLSYFGIHGYVDLDFFDSALFQ